MQINPIGKIENDFDTKFAVPRQSGLINSIKSRIVFDDKYADYSAFKGLEGFSHIWIIWEFDKNSHKSELLTVRPPRLGGNERVGVFASRAPYRPNPIGLSSVRLEKIEADENGRVSLIVSGADLVNGTKIYDIKPYIRISDLHEDAVSGYSDEMKDYSIEVCIPHTLSDRMSAKEIDDLTALLAADPRPAYHDDCDRVYGFRFAGREIKFVIKDGILTVTEISNE